MAADVDDEYWAAVLFVPRLGYQLSSCVGCTRYALVPLSPGCTGGRSVSSPDASTASSNVLKEAGFATESIRAALTSSACCR